MIGKVIEGRYVGASICKLPEKNVLFIETEDGERIALSKKNAISIDDVTDQYPSHEGRLMLVMWNDFETSILQLGNVGSKQQTESRRERVQPSKQQDAKHKKGNLKSSKRVPVRKKNKLPWIMVALLSCIIVTAFAVFILHNVQPDIQAASHSREHSGQDASCDKIGHEGGEWVIVSEATVCTPGTHARYCIRCNKVVEQSNYYKPVHQNGFYEFSANDFATRLRSILQSKDGNFDATITSASTDAINVTISVNYKPAALFFFLNNNETVGGNENSIIKASSIMVTMVSDDTYQREVILPAIVECCNNDMKTDVAMGIVDRFVSTGSYQYDGLSYTWGKYQGYDTVTIDLNAASSKTQVDPQEEVPVETAMPEQVVEYRWQEPKYLSFPLADVQITMRKVENIEGAKPAYAIEIICDSMTSKELMTFMIHSTDDWGFDRISLVERIQKVLDMYDDAWANDTMFYCSMSGYGIEWTVSLGSDDHYCGIIGLTTNKPNEFEAVLGMMPQDASTEENTIISSDGITNWPTQELDALPISAEKPFTQVRLMVSVLNLNLVNHSRWFFFSMK